MGVTAEAYQLEILDGSVVKRTIACATAAYVYETGDQTADFGAPPASLRLRVAQLGENGQPGLNKELTITL